MKPAHLLLQTGLVLAIIASTSPAPAQTRLFKIPPAAADPRVRSFLQPSYVLAPKQSSASTPLVVFLTGTGGAPEGILGFLSVIAGQGYRVIGLEYDDTPAVAQVCPRDPDPACSDLFRRMRVDGDGASRQVSNPPAESISARLTAALKQLERSRPGEGWAQYLDGDQPDWRRLVVSGLSQGAGMAAYIAKHHEVLRVVLFSSPWDVTGPSHAPAPWLSEPSATPPERWYAEYHRRELTADLIARAYAALAIPPSNLRIFDHDLPADFHGSSPNPFHVNTIRDVRYEADWRTMFGQAADLK